MDVGSDMDLSELVRTIETTPMIVRNPKEDKSLEHSGHSNAEVWKIKIGGPCA